MATINAMCEIDVHNDRTYKEHRNLEIRKRVTTCLFRYETPFITFELKVSTQGERIFLCWLLHLAPISFGTHGAQIRLASASPKSRTSSFGV